MDSPTPATILIIDDEERNRKLLDVLAKADGHLTFLATNGKDAIRIARFERPDLVLLDLMMPGIDGFDVLRSLKGDPATCSIPVMIVSALDDVAAQRRMLSAGADDFICKPVDRWEFTLRVARLLGKLPSEEDADA
jgi:putative two-component system response regulator